MKQVFFSVILCCLPLGLLAEGIGTWKSDKLKTLSYFEKHNKPNDKLRSYIENHFGQLKFSMNDGVWTRCFESYAVSDEKNGFTRPVVCWHGTYDLIKNTANYLILSVTEEQQKENDGKFETVTWVFF